MHSACGQRISWNHKHAQKQWPTASMARLRASLEALMSLFSSFCITMQRPCAACSVAGGAMGVMYAACAVGAAHAACAVHAIAKWCTCYVYFVQKMCVLCGWAGWARETSAYRLSKHERDRPPRARCAVRAPARPRASSCTALLCAMTTKVNVGAKWRKGQHMFY
jgi:hypothetical protein